MDAIVHEGIEVLTHPSKLRDIATLGHDDIAAFAKLTLTPPDARTVFRGPGVVSKRAVWAEPIPLDDIKAIGRPVYATVNDVLLSAVSGASAAISTAAAAGSTTSAPSSRSTSARPTSRFHHLGQQVRT